MRLDRLDIKFFKQAVGHERLGRETDNDISARCPVCGDSRKNKNSKRLHLYKKGEVTNVNCFNGDCPAQNKTMYGFLLDFFPSLLDSYKRERFQENMHSLASGETDVFGSIVDKPESLELDDWEDSEIARKENLDKRPIRPITTFDLSNYIKDIEEIPAALEFLNNRGIIYDPDLFGRWFYGYQDLEIGDTVYKVTNCIIIPLYYDISDVSTMYGFYARSIGVGSKYFCTFMHDVNIGYKVWNLFNINKSEPVYIFEGIFDAISSGKKNIIALMGAKIPDGRLSELEKPIFVLDNDRTGWKNSLEYADKGFNVFIQPNKYKEKDMNELMQKHPDLDIPALINNNIFKGIMARVKISSLL